MLVNTQTELMYPALDGVLALGKLDGCGCGCKGSCGGDKKVENALSGIGEIAPTNCGWWSLPGSKCYNYAHYPTPPVVTPIVPPLTSGGGTTATIDEIIAGTFGKQREVWDEVIGGAAPEEEKAGISGWWVVGGLLVGGIILIKKL